MPQIGSHRRIGASRKPLLRMDIYCEKYAVSAQLSEGPCARASLGLAQGATIE